MRAPQSDLVRVVAVMSMSLSGQAGDRKDAVAWLDINRSQHGRGAYLHLAMSCLDLAERRRALPRALRLSGGLDTAGLRDQITEYLRGTSLPESP